MTDTSTYRPFSGAWLRFSAYEVRSCYVRPAPGARLKPPYDVWAAFEEARGQKRKQLWESFITLAAPPIDYDDPRTADRIVSWCNKWGLPGLLLARARRVALAPRWGGGGSQLPIQTIYAAISGGWEEQQAELFSLTEDNPRPPDAAGGDLVGENDLHRLFAPYLPSEPPGVEIRQGNVLGDWVREGLDQEWAVYFPDIPDTEAANYLYPLPLTDEFWHLYAEPIAEISYAARLLRITVALLAGEDVLENGGDRGQRVKLGIQYLEKLLEGAHMGIRERDGHWWQIWYSSSLIGYMALMIYRNMTEGPGGIRLCEAKDCRVPFAAKTALDHYCSTTCRNRANIQRYRRKKGGAK